MTSQEKCIIDKLRDRLGENRLETVIIYYDHSLKQKADRLFVGGLTIDLPWDGQIAFVDLEPGVNWGHACAYFAIRQDGDDVIEFAAHMPPFLKAETSTFHMLWRGSLAPEWAVVTNLK